MQVQFTGSEAKEQEIAVTQPGTEVAPAEVGGQARGAHGRWAVLLHRIRPAVPLPASGGTREVPADAPGSGPGTTGTAYALGEADPLRAGDSGDYGSSGDSDGVST